MLLNGKEFSKKLKNNLKIEVENLIKENNIKPGLAIVLVGNNPASEIYVRNNLEKQKRNDADCK